MLNKNIYTIFSLCCGASIGAFMRYYTNMWVNRNFHDGYIATASVNIVGSFCIGILFVCFNEISSPRLQVALITGLLGSFTTFSTLSLDTVKLLASGQVATAMLQLAGQIIFGISFCYFGVKIAEKLI